MHGVFDAAAAAQLAAFCVCLVVSAALQCQVAMAADGMGGRDAASLLASLATLQHTPKSAGRGVC